MGPPSRTRSTRPSGRPARARPWSGSAAKSGSRSARPPARRPSPSARAPRDARHAHRDARQAGGHDVGNRRPSSAGSIVSGPAQNARPSLRAAGGTRDGALRQLADVRDVDDQRIVRRPLLGLEDPRDRAPDRAHWRRGRRRSRSETPPACPREAPGRPPRSPRDRAASGSTAITRVTQSCRLRGLEALGCRDLQARRCRAAIESRGYSSARLLDALRFQHAIVGGPRHALDGPHERLQAACGSPA